MAFFTLLRTGIHWGRALWRTATMQESGALMLPVFLRVKDGRVMQQGARTRAMKPVPAPVVLRVPIHAIARALPVRARGSPVMTHPARPPSWH